MNRKIILLIVLIVAGAVFAYVRFYIPHPSQTANCSIGNCDVYHITDSKTEQKVIPQDTTRTPNQVGTSTPSDFPKDLPVDSKPVRVLEKYSETISGNVSEGESSHTQSVYSYITKKTIAEEVSAFKEYLEINSYKVTVTEARTGKNVQGFKDSKESIQGINISINNQTSTTTIVSVSIVTSFKMTQ